MVGMLVVPLPSILIDLSIACNLAAAVAMLLIAIYVRDPLAIATFPSLLLLTTLFRLAIEVSATRLILLEANAGQIIRAFGGFVVAGNLVVGIVVFAILTTVQYVVIAKGAARVAEVGARFTLDAMPGKQLSIDAELRAGHLDANQARQRRSMLTKESQFFGSMDGAMKFVKGDAVAGIVVLFVNIVGGLLVGVVQRHMDVATALNRYTLLTIGEGLVAQIPALVLSTAAGILVTRVWSGESLDSQSGDSHLAAEIGRQVLAQPKALAATSAILALLALLPGLPAVPFLALAAILAVVAYRLIKSESAVARSGPAGTGAERPSAPLLIPIAIDLSAEVSEVLLPDRGPSMLASAWQESIRERFYAESGISIPAISVYARVQGLLPLTYRIRIQEIPVADAALLVDRLLVQESPERLARLGIATEPANHPDGTAAAWIAQAERPAAIAQGHAVLAWEQIIAVHLLGVLRNHGYRLVGIQETRALLDRLELTHPDLVREVVPAQVRLALLADILQRLAREGISLRNLSEILAALSRRATSDQQAVSLAEWVRRSLQQQITFKHTGSDGTVGAFLLDPMIEETVREAIRPSESGGQLALDPQARRDIVAAVERALAGRLAPVILTSGDFRPHVRGLCEAEHPQVAVLAYQELLPQAKVTTLGRIAI